MHVEKYSYIQPFRTKGMCFILYKLFLITAHNIAMTWYKIYDTDANEDISLHG